MRTLQTSCPSTKLRCKKTLMQQNTTDLSAISGNQCLQQMEVFNAQIELAAAGLCPLLLPKHKGCGKGPRLPPPPPPPPKGKGKGKGATQNKLAGMHKPGLGALGSDIQGHQGSRRVSVNSPLHIPARDPHTGVHFCSKAYPICQDIGSRNR